jgi:hypothetical protein
VRPRPLPEAERLEPIGLESLDATAALRRRFDIKYLLSREAVVELLSRLEQTHRVLDIDGLRDFEYRTTYFDTPELGAFRDHIQGRRRRLKARVRHYAETGACFFELKLRGPRESTIKRRLPHAVGLHHQLTPESLATLEQWVRDAYGRPAPSPLAPTLDVAFRRTTLVAPERGERLTSASTSACRRPAPRGGAVSTQSSPSLRASPPRAWPSLPWSSGRSARGAWRA